MDIITYSLRVETSFHCSFMVKLKDICEQKLLKIINKYCDYGVACDRHKKGDDAAILELSENQKLVVTTDVLVENVHFSDLTTPPDSIGYRAVTANLSDIAAMGAMPLGITVGLSLRADVEVKWVEQLYQGMHKCLESYHISIIGGDITRSQVNTIAITALGQVQPHHIIYRHQAKIGDLILITGNHGFSRAGLELLLYPHKYSHISSEIKEKVISHHQYPQPRLDIIKQLDSYLSNSNSEETNSLIIAGMDSSDGLADAIIQICQQSQVGAKIDLSQLRIAPEILEITNQDTASEWMFYGGEDFELVLCLSKNIAQYLLTKFPHDCQVIGEITKNPKIEIIDPSDNQLKFFLNQKKTFQHF